MVIVEFRFLPNTWVGVNHVKEASAIFWYATDGCRRPWLRGPCEEWDDNPEFLFVAKPTAMNGWHMYVPSNCVGVLPQAPFVVDVTVVAVVVLCILLLWVGRGVVVLLS